MNLNKELVSTVTHFNLIKSNLLNAVTFLSFVLLVSCQSTINDESYYGSLGGDIDVIGEVLKQCELKSVQMVPANTVIQSSPSYTTPITCGPSYGGFNSCTGGDTFGGGISSYDANAGLREQVRNDCITSKGVVKITSLPKCPKKWSLGGWYDGRLSAEELASLYASFYSDVLYNRIDELRFPDTIFYRQCLWQRSDKTSSGMTQTLANFPEKFFKSTDDEKHSWVIYQRNLFKRRNSIARLSFDEFSELVEFMQIKIDYCTDKIGTDEILLSIYVEPEKLKTLKRDLCIKDEYPVKSSK